MSFTHSARIIDPIVFIDAEGRRSEIPIGPCLLEEQDAEHIGVFWGPAGEESALLAPDDVESAEASGKLLLLD
jgi:hypothetical protein